MGTEGKDGKALGFGVVRTPHDSRLEGRWTRDAVIQALRDYQSLYGECVAACFNPSSAKWGSRPDRRERYLHGNPLQEGAPWPSLNAIKDHFPDPETGKPSFDQAKLAAGLPLSSTGPPKGRRAAGLHEPIRDIRDRVIVLPPERAKVAVLRAVRAEGKVERLMKRIARLERQVNWRDQRIAQLERRNRELEGAAVSLVDDLAS